MKKILLFSVITFLIISCTTPLDKKYSEENLVLDAKEIKKGGNLSEEDTQIMAGWIIRAKLTII